VTPGAHQAADAIAAAQGARVISDNYFCRLATTTFAGGSAVRTACATVRS
jgi:hypothetical protein